MCWFQDFSQLYFVKCYTSVVKTSYLHLSNLSLQSKIFKFTACIFFNSWWIHMCTFVLLRSNCRAWLSIKFYILGHLHLKSSLTWHNHPSQNFNWSSIIKFLHFYLLIEQFYSFICKCIVFATKNAKMQWRGRHGQRTFQHQELLNWEFAIRVTQSVIILWIIHQVPAEGGLQY